MDKKYYWKDLALLQGSVGRMSLDVADQGLLRIRKIMWEFLKTGYRSRPKSDVYIYICIHVYIYVYVYVCVYVYFFSRVLGSGGSMLRKSYVFLS